MAGTKDVEIVMQVKRAQAFGQKSEIFFKKILESRPEDAPVKLEKTVETFETFETVET